MKKLLVILFLFSISLNLWALDGYWKQMHPEENGDVPGPRYMHFMCPIGERKALLLNGLGSGRDGNPSAYNDTWIYDYDLDKWTKIECELLPDTYDAGGMAQISKNRAFVRATENPPPGSISAQAVQWLFDLDSLKWIRINLFYRFWRRY